MVDDAAAHELAPLLDVKGLMTHFRTDLGVVKAVDGVDLAVRPGEVVSIVGESGSGKSVTALSIVRLIHSPGEIIAGKIKLDGQDLLQLSEKEMAHIRGNRIALLSQAPNSMLDPTSRIGAHIVEPLRLFTGLSKAAAWDRAVELLAAVEIPDPERRVHSYVGEMSGGMAQRVMLATALAGDPALLIADEPTTALDVTVQAQILQLMTKLCDENDMALLLISHDLGVVAAISDRVAVMYAGQIVEEAPAIAIYGDARHPYTKALMRASSLQRGVDGRLFTIPRAEVGARHEGCRFLDRCHEHIRLNITDTCGSVPPSLVTGSDGQHTSRCFALERPPVDWPHLDRPTS